MRQNPKIGLPARKWNIGHSSSTSMFFARRRRVVCRETSLMTGFLYRCKWEPFTNPCLFHSKANFVPARGRPGHKRFARRPNVQPVPLSVRQGRVWKNLPGVWNRPFERLQIHKRTEPRLGCYIHVHVRHRWSWQGGMGPLPRVARFQRQKNKLHHARPRSRQAVRLVCTQNRPRLKTGRAFKNKPIDRGFRLLRLELAGQRTKQHPGRRRPSEGGSE